MKPERLDIKKEMLTWAVTRYGLSVEEYAHASNEGLAVGGYNDKV